MSLENQVPRVSQGARDTLKALFDDEAFYNALGDKADKSVLTSVETQLSQL